MIRLLLAAWLLFGSVWADAGQDQTVRPGLVQLHGRASHDFVWSQIAGPPVRFPIPKTLEPRLQLPRGRYQFLLIVSDGKQIVTSVVTITVGDIA